MVASELTRGIVGRPVSLEPELERRFPALTGVHWRRGGLLPRLGGWFLGARSVAAITLWRTVWLGDGVEATAELLLHELCHVRQFETVPLFPVRYIWEWARRGYQANRFEVEARHFAAAGTGGPDDEPSREDV